MSGDEDIGNDLVCRDSGLHDLAASNGVEVMVPVPAIVAAAGGAAGFAWDEFFGAQISNPHTRRAYQFGARKFLAWCDERSLVLNQISPGNVGRYFNELAASTPTKKLHLAAIRGLFDVLVQRHVLILNPALSVRLERYAAVEGRTPEISVEHARQLLLSIPRIRPVDLRDAAIISVLIYTAARACAVAKLRMGDFQDEGNQFVLRFAEKGGKARTIPVRHDLQLLLSQYRATLGESTARDPLFRTCSGRSGELTSKQVSGVDICRMVKRRLFDAELPGVISPHSFRSCTATDLLLQGVSLEDVQYLLGHADARTTRLYDRRQKRVTRNIVERISV
jgi:integrase/recombinase XerD